MPSPLPRPHQGTGKYRVELDEPKRAAGRAEKSRFEARELQQVPAGAASAKACPLLGHWAVVTRTSKAEVNGLEGVVTGWDAAAGRYVVTVADAPPAGGEGRTRSLKLKPENVVRRGEYQGEPAPEPESDDDSLPPLDDEVGNSAGVGSGGGDDSLPGLNGSPDSGGAGGEESDDDLPPLGPTAPGSQGGGGGGAGSDSDDEMPELSSSGVGGDAADAPRFEPITCGTTAAITCACQR